ncbi:hypothetical protein MICAG_2400006 [Microcystis aeruginosa PCC 9808]|uniref:Uncharacterized protein n=1 Tax=Microcystis aeruginosa PCC 9808 TaxID=1160284 RepID=I4HQF8_MICAE|nr:hypothetical protein MICAG_2400006 [Microcystis aeruginosa PCC 9808]
MIQQRLLSYQLSVISDQSTALNETGINLIGDQISLDKEAEAVATRC